MIDRRFRKWIFLRKKETRYSATRANRELQATFFFFFFFFGWGFLGSGFYMVLGSVILRFKVGRVGDYAAMSLCHHVTY